MATLDDVLGKVVPRTKTVRIVLDGALADEFDRFEAELADAEAEDRRRGDGIDYRPKAPQIAEKLVRLSEQARDSEIEFVFTSIGMRAWSELRLRHQPTEAELKAHPGWQHLDFHPETFPPAAVAASLTEPEGVTPEGIERLRDKINEGQWSRLWTGCLHANLGPGDVGESDAASAVIRSYAERSRRLSSSESPGRSSSDG